MMKRFATDSMFYRLFGSFLIVILLLCVFIGVAFTVFLNTIRAEITKSSSLNLDTAVRNYEEHFEQIRSIGLSLQFDEQISILSRQQRLPSETVAAVRDQLRASVASPYLYLENLLIYMKRSLYVIEKDSSADAELFFNKLFYSEQYPLQFWHEQLELPVSFAIYPSSPYWENSLGTPVSKGQYIPILIKRVYDDQSAVLAFMDSRRAYLDFFRPKQGDAFTILDSGGRTLFASSVTALPHDVLQAGSGTGYVKADDHYYFYQHSGKSGFTYVSVIPFKHINAQVVRLTFILAVLLAAAVLISVTVSAWISRKLNAPVRHLVEWIGQLQPGRPQSNIREFRLIGDRINHIAEDIHQKNSMLNLYGYADQLKRIGQLSDHFQPLDKPFRLLLFHLTPERPALLESSQLQQDTAFVREHARDWYATHVEHAITLQLEPCEILTVLHFDEGEEPELEEVTSALMQLLGPELQACLMTVAISGSYSHVKDFARAYADVSALVKQRKLGREAQLVTRFEPPPSLPSFSGQEEQDFYANLTGGNREVVLPLVRRVLGRLERKQAYACQYDEVANEVVNRVMKTLYTHHIELSKLPGRVSPYEEMKACHTQQEYVDRLESLLSAVCELVQEKKSANDPITSFVTTYIEQHYAEDISLDMLADRLHITRGYLSSYFKEKTGINFVDFLTTYRMDKAKEILSRTDLKIQEVAQLVGYVNVSTFIRVFKKQTGTTPGDYKKLKTG
ncbi:helix-turn-helix transcriptional regulator [Paenibacillus sp. 1P07SE]|uniref:helix-turn-helix domain-containing protein n=1 Tax=Paenibacillus sp. 1P07SE TaxID=3132209 RepID=UPI0039A517FF